MPVAVVEEGSPPREATRDVPDSTPGGSSPVRRESCQEERLRLTTENGTQFLASERGQWQ